jgi:hypothetical protein
MANKGGATLLALETKELDNPYMQHIRKKKY